MKRRSLFGLLLAIALLFGLLAGCTPGGATPDPNSAEDWVLALADIPRDTVLLTINGEEVTAEEYLFWLGRAVSSGDPYGLGIDWAAEQDGLSAAEYFKNDALEAAKLDLCASQLAAAAGCTITEQDEADYQLQLSQMSDSLGGPEYFALWLKGNALTDDGLWRMIRNSFLYQHYAALYQGDGPHAPTAEQIKTYIAENDLLRAKHILLSTVDTTAARDPETGLFPPLEETVITEKLALAEDLLRQLRESDDPATLFDTLMFEHSEDGGLLANPDGYLFSSGEMVAPFEEGTRALEFGAISEIVESTFGYHIILRLDPDTDSLRAVWAGDQVTLELEAAIDAADVQTTAAYDAIDPEDFYTRLSAHQTAVVAEMDALTASKATPTPEGDGEGEPAS